MGSAGLYVGTVSEDMELPTDGTLTNAIRLTADYGDKAVALVYESYTGVDGRYLVDEQAVVVDKGTSCQSIYEEYVPEEPESYPGLKFTGWNTENIGTTVESSGTVIYVEAEYSNYLVRIIIDDMYAGSNWG